MIKNTEVFFCNTCVMSNQKVLSSSTVEDDPEHSNRHNLEFENGKCFACIEVEKKYNNEINWKDKELELNELLNKYRSKNRLKAEFIGRGGTWLDTGNIEDFYSASNYVSSIENRQGLKIACLEEISLYQKWIGGKDIKQSIKFYGNCDYSNYLKKLIK